MTTQYCETSIERGCSVFTLNPSVNDVQWAEIESIGDNILSSIEGKSSPAVLIDLTKLEYMGSAMVALIVRVWKKVEKQNGKMVVANRHELVYEVLKLAGLTKMWTIVNTREEGLRQLGGGSVSASGSNMGLVLMGIVSVIGALFGLWILLSNSNLLPHKAALVLEFGFAAFGIIMGTLLFSKSSGTSRGMGLLIIVACLAIAVCGIVKLPVGTVAGPPQGETEADGQTTDPPEESKSTEKESTSEGKSPEEIAPAKNSESEKQQQGSKKSETKPAETPKAEKPKAEKPAGDSATNKPE